MKFIVKNGDICQQISDCLVVAVFENGQLSQQANKLDQLSEGYLSQLISEGDLSGKVGETVLLRNVANVPTSRLIIVGCGKQGELTERQYKQVIQNAVQAIKGTNAKNAVFALDDVAIKERSSYWALRFAVETIAEHGYSYDEFKSIKPETKSHLAEITFAVSDADLEQAQLAVAQGQAVAQGVFFAKNVANCPPNVCTPKYLAECAKDLAKQYSTIQTTIIDEKEMAALGMNAYLAVSQGSTKHPAYMSIIEYKNHPNPNAKPIVLVGKGMTFDTGGISIKPSEAMDEMKYDMGGAASVYGTMKALAEMQLPLNVVGVLAGCENMPDGNAYRPGDILKTMSGLTVEVLNTDAEGRLVLCDALTYVERFEPECVIDIATLTGACMVALGQHNSGLISTSDELAEQLLGAAKQADDKAWRLPMGEEYQEQLKSNFADLANIGGRFGGAITAGVFLSNFAKNFTWAHLDIAGTAWKSGAAKGATGRPVPMLSQFLIEKAQG